MWKGNVIAKDRKQGLNKNKKLKHSSWCHQISNTYKFDQIQLVLIDCEEKSAAILLKPTLIMWSKKNREHVLNLNMKVPSSGTLNGHWMEP